MIFLGHASVGIDPLVMVILALGFIVLAYKTGAMILNLGAIGCILALVYEMFMGQHGPAQTNVGQMFIAIPLIGIVVYLLYITFWGYKQ